jgi:hypothetical protein
MDESTKDQKENYRLYMSNAQEMLDVAEELLVAIMPILPATAPIMR